MERALLFRASSVIIGLIAGIIAFPQIFYDRFIWKYFWGPIVADASGNATVVYNGVVAQSGYTLVNEIGYALLLIASIFILVRLLKRLDKGGERRFVLSFTPFVIGGGLLRVVEDSGTVSGPLEYLLISPLIYFTMFFIAVSGLLIAFYVERRTSVDYRKIVFGLGTVFSTFIGIFLFFSLPVMNLWMIPAALGITGILTFTVFGFNRITGNLEELVSAENLVVLSGHLLDGSATSLSIEILGYGEKHPVVRLFIELTGSAYMFILLKLFVIGGIIYYLGKERDPDSPRFYNLILLGILAVGLGPGTRNLVRALFGI
ncbi:MAG: DUF63 family protein [Candidatus Nanohaloarchaeota archaeon QJJ-7]|nr:DUF63 family protein [Candidatus Nanohaloarchaeota archaeon QJJ-7]